jgi:uncharacterized protein YggT (Ycf19 family)
MQTELMAVWPVIGSSAVLFDVIGSIETFITVFVSVYVLLLFAYILSSWVKLPYSPWLNRIQRFLYDVCEPYLRLFRRFVPMAGPLDLSPIVAILVLYIARTVVISVLDQLR